MIDNIKYLTKRDHIRYLRKKSSFTGRCLTFYLYEYCKMFKSAISEGKKALDIGSELIKLEEKLGYKKNLKLREDVGEVRKHVSELRIFWGHYLDNMN